MAEDGSRIRVLCPLRFEHSRLARTLRRLDLDVECIGPGKAGVEGWFDRAPGRFGSAMPRLVVLAGLAGGLAHVVRPGRAFVCSRVVTSSGELIGECSVSKERIPHERPIVTSTAGLVSTPEERADLFRESGAHIADQESVTFVRRAVACSVPWLIVRGISDGPDDTLPIGIEKWVDQRGRTRVVRVAMSTIRRPTSFAAVVRLGRRSGIALSEVARLIQLVAASHNEQ